jgi:hypothetical protein
MQGQGVGSGQHPDFQGGPADGGKNAATHSQQTTTEYLFGHTRLRSKGKRKNKGMNALGTLRRIKAAGKPRNAAGPGIDAPQGN